MSSTITPWRNPSHSPSKKQLLACSHRLQLKHANRMAAATEACAISLCDGEGALATALTNSYIRNTMPTVNAGVGARTFRPGSRLGQD